MEALINTRFGKNAAIPPNGQLDEPPVFFVLAARLNPLTGDLNIENEKSYV